MKYKLFDSERRINKNNYEQIYKIIIDNYAIREKLNAKQKKEINTKEVYDAWVKMILTTKNYNIIIFYDNDIIIGFIAFMYDERGLCLSEVQIEKTISQKIIIDFLRNSNYVQRL